MDSRVVYIVGLEGGDDFIWLSGKWNTHCRWSPGGYPGLNFLSVSLTFTRPELRTAWSQPFIKLAAFQSVIPSLNYSSIDYFVRRATSVVFKWVFSDVSPAMIYALLKVFQRHTNHSFSPCMCVRLNLPVCIFNYYTSVIAAPALKLIRASYERED